MEKNWVSSPVSTYIYKIAFPIFWYMVIILSFFADSKEKVVSPNQAQLESFLFPFLMGTGAIFVVVVAIMFKHVWIENNRIHIKGFFLTKTFSIDDLVEYSELVAFRPLTVKIVLKDAHYYFLAKSSVEKLNQQITIIDVRSNLSTHK
jgi:hypothetical protein